MYTSPSDTISGSTLNHVGEEPAVRWGEAVATKIRSRLKYKSRSGNEGKIQHFSGNTSLRRKDERKAERMRRLLSNRDKRNSGKRGYNETGTFRDRKGGQVEVLAPTSFAVTPGRQTGLGGGKRRTIAVHSLRAINPRNMITEFSLTIGDLRTMMYTANESMQAIIVYTNAQVGSKEVMKRLVAFKQTKESMQALSEENRRLIRQGLPTMARSLIWWSLRPKQRRVPN